MYRPLTPSAQGPSLRGETLALSRLLYWRIPGEGASERAGRQPLLLPGRSVVAHDRDHGAERNPAERANENARADRRGAPSAESDPCCHREHTQQEADQGTDSRCSLKFRPCLP